jgi:hypothetical protein
MRKDASDSVWFANYCAEMEAANGRGWKRRLAEKVGVSESNVQTWLKSGRVPPAVHRAIMLSDRIDELNRDATEQVRMDGSRWIEEKTIHGEKRFSVHEMNMETGRGRLVAGSITSEDDAREIANLPIVKARIEEAYSRLWLENKYDDPADQPYVKALAEPGWRNLTPRERDARMRNSLRKD